MSNHTPNYDTPEGAVLRLLLVAGRRVIDNRHRESWRFDRSVLIESAFRNLGQALPAPDLAAAHVDLADVLVYAAFAFANADATNAEECLLRFAGHALGRVVANRHRADQWRDATAEVHAATAALNLLTAGAPDTAPDAGNDALADAAVYAAFAAYLLSLEPREAANPA